MFRKVTPGSAGDTQLFSYFVDTDLVITADKALLEILDECRQPSRHGEYPRTILANWSGVMQADAFAGFNELYAEGRRPGRSSRPRAGRTAGATSSTWRGSPRRPSPRRSCAASTNCSPSSATSTANRPMKGEPRARNTRNGAVMSGRRPLIKGYFSALRWSWVRSCLRLRHRQTKGAETDMLGLTPPRHTPTYRRRSSADGPRGRRTEDQIPQARRPAQPPAEMARRGGRAGGTARRLSGSLRTSWASC